MIYIITGFNSTAKHHLARSIISSLNKKTIKHNGYIIETPEDDSTRVEKISSNTGYVIFEKNKNTDKYYHEYMNIIDDINAKLNEDKREALPHIVSKFVYEKDVLLFGIEDEEQAQNDLNNNKIFNEMKAEIDSQLKTAKNCIIVSNMIQKHVDLLKEQYGSENVEYVFIKRHPIASLALEENMHSVELPVGAKFTDFEEHNVNKLYEKQIHYFERFNEFFFCAQVINKTEIKFEDIILNGRFAIKDQEFFVHDDLAFGNSIHFTAWEIENKDLKENERLFETFKSEVCEKFDVFNDAKGKLPRNVFDYYNYGADEDIKELR